MIQYKFKKYFKKQILLLQISQLFKVFGDVTRLKIITLLYEKDEMIVEEIVTWKWNNLRFDINYVIYRQNTIWFLREERERERTKLGNMFCIPWMILMYYLCIGWL